MPLGCEVARVGVARITPTAHVPARRHKPRARISGHLSLCRYSLRTTISTAMQRCWFRTQAAESFIDFGECPRSLARPTPDERSIRHVPATIPQRDDIRPVGVSYETDVRLLRKIILDVGASHGAVLKPPRGLSQTGSENALGLACTRRLLRTGGIGRPEWIDGIARLIQTLPARGRDPWN
jgi:hypothetical protein